MTKATRSTKSWETGASRLGKEWYRERNKSPRRLGTQVKEVQECLARESRLRAGMESQVKDLQGWLDGEKRARFGQESEVERTRECLDQGGRVRVGLEQQVVNLCATVQRGMSELPCEKERNGWLERKVKEL